MTDPRHDRVQVEALLPHRDPFLFVDAFRRAEDGSVVASWTVPMDADWFRGHYPGAPVLPGVLVVEHALQAAALLIASERAGFRAEDGVPVVTRLTDVRFRRMVGPGAILETEVKLEERQGPAYWLHARVRRGGERIAEVRCALAVSGELERATGGGGGGA
jgi:3-hydroxyacyl-[acyl-carrier-protein] dehydratase